MPPALRHQSSFEGILDFSAGPPLGADERIEGKRKLYRILEHFEAEEDDHSSQYNRPRLIRFTYEYALSEESRDNLLRAFLNVVGLSMESPEDVDFEELQSKVFGFADYLLDNFFLPLKASSRKTPQPSPAYHSAIQRVQGGVQEFAGTRDRVSALRGACLVRDRHRCVISRKFDQNEADIRFEKDGDDARDDDGVALIEDIQLFSGLEVAHILPHSLTKTNTGSQLDPSKEAALAILNMFDTGVIYLIEGPEIDRPRNAITLTRDLHNFFGSFKIFFEPPPDQPPHTYTIGTFRQKHLFRDPSLPVTRTLSLTDTRTIDPPSPRLLAIHHAIAHILHLSGAGDYIERLLRDAEKGIRADGSTELGRLVQLGLGGWLDGPVCT